MKNKEEFEFFVDQLLNNAVENFKSTEQYKLLEEKLEKMDEDCMSMFTQNQQDFVEKCFETILEVSGQQETYVYRRGLTDCIFILKELGVLT